LALAREALAVASTDGQAPGREPEEHLQALEAELTAVHRALSAAQAEERLVSFEVCPRLVAEVISAWTGVPQEQLAREHNARVASFADDLRARIRGQEQAVQALDRSMRASAPA